MAITPLCAATGTVVWPEWLSPHAPTEPSFFTATVWYPPPAHAVSLRGAATGTVVWPEELSPHAPTASGIGAWAVLTPGQAQRMRSSVRKWFCFFITLVGRSVLNV